MRKHVITVAVVCALAGSMMMSSCIGSFTLTNKLLAWNQNISNKFVNELVFFAFWFLPVYEVAVAADAVVLNSIEFWSGTNPVDGTLESRVIEGNDGKYLVTTDPTGYTVVSQTDGATVRFDFDSESRTWTLVDGDRRIEILTWVDDTHVLLPAPDGNRRLFETSADGLYAYRQMATDALFATR